jgi:hypothetical protein
MNQYPPHSGLNAKCDFSLSKFRDFFAREVTEVTLRGKNRGNYQPKPARWRATLSTLGILQLTKYISFGISLGLICAVLIQPVFALDTTIESSDLTTNMAKVIVSEPVTPAKSPPLFGCKIGGCSNQLCVDASIPDPVTTCEWRESYACYQSAQCQVQVDGHCGWTLTPELQKCLDSPDHPYPPPTPNQIPACDNICDPDDACPPGVACFWEGRCPSDCSPVTHPPTCGNNICEPDEADDFWCPPCDPKSGQCIMAPCYETKGTCPQDCISPDTGSRPTPTPHPTLTPSPIWRVRQPKIQPFWNMLRLLFSRIPKETP